MSFKNIKPSELYGPAYQVSGKPFVTSSATNEVGTSALEIPFPTVTRWVQVTNHGAQNMHVGFSENGTNGQEFNNYYILGSTGASTAALATTARWELRCKSIFVKMASGTGTVSVSAGLTGIPVLATNLSGSAGVG